MSYFDHLDRHGCISSRACMEESNERTQAVRPRRGEGTGSPFACMSRSFRLAWLFVLCTNLSTDTSCSLLQRPAHSCSFELMLWRTVHAGRHAPACRAMCAVIVIAGSIGKGPLTRCLNSLVRGDGWCCACTAHAFICITLSLEWHCKRSASGITVTGPFKAPLGTNSTCVPQPIRVHV